MVNYAKDEDHAEAGPIKGMSKEQIDAQIEKYDRTHKDAEDAGPDAFRNYCEATCFDERVAIQ